MERKRNLAKSRPYCYYSTVPNEIGSKEIREVWNPPIDSIGLYSFMYMLPENWNLTSNGIADTIDCSVQKTTKMLKQLEEMGYMKSFSLDAKGKLNGHQYIVYRHFLTGYIMEAIRVFCFGCVKKINMTDLKTYLVIGEVLDIILDFQWRSELQDMIKLNNIYLFIISRTAAILDLMDDIFNGESFSLKEFYVPECKENFYRVILNGNIEELIENQYIFQNEENSSKSEDEKSENNINKFIEENSGNSTISKKFLYSKFQNIEIQNIEIQNIEKLGQYNNTGLMQELRKPVKSVSQISHDFHIKNQLYKKRAISYLFKFKINLNNLVNIDSNNLNNLRKSNNPISNITQLSSFSLNLIGNKSLFESHLYSILLNLNRCLTYSNGRLKLNRNKCISHDMSEEEFEKENSMYIKGIKQSNTKEITDETQQTEDLVRTSTKDVVQAANGIKLGEQTEGEKILANKIREEKIKQEAIDSESRYKGRLGRSMKNAKKYIRKYNNDGEIIRLFEDYVQDRISGGEVMGESRIRELSDFLHTLSIEEQIASIKQSISKGYKKFYVDKEQKKSQPKNQNTTSDKNFFGGVFGR